MAGQVFDQFDHAGRFLGAGAGHRLVEEQQLRPRGKRHGQFQRPLFAVRQIAGDDIGLVGQSELFEVAVRLVEERCLVSYRAPETKTAAGIWPSLNGQRHVVERREAEEDVGDLVRTCHAQPHALMHGQPGDLPPGEMDAAGIRLQGTGNVVDEGSLASPVGADQGMHLAGGDGEIDILQGVYGGETARQAADFEQGFSHASSRTARRRRGGRRARHRAGAGRARYASAR